MADVTVEPPNYTQTPNAIFELMADESAHLTDAELRVLLAITRQTFGWHRQRDKISLSQLMKLTGMSRQGVVNGIEAGMKRGLIGRSPDEGDKRGGIWYFLLVNEVDQSSTLTSHEVDQSTTLTRTSQRGRPVLVNGVDQSCPDLPQTDAPETMPKERSKEKKEIGGGGYQNESPSKSAPAPVFEKLAEVCRIPIALASQKKRQELGRAASKLYQAGATLEQLNQFAVWLASEH